MAEPFIRSLRLWEDDPLEAETAVAETTVSGGKAALRLAEEKDGFAVTGVERCGDTLAIPGEIDGRKVVAIGTSAFQGITALCSVTLPDGLRRIGRSAFQGCTSLVDLKLPENLEHVGAQAFQGCASLESAELPAGLTEIPDRVFYGCASLKSVALPEGILQIGERAFAGCRSLAQIRLPDGLKRIAPMAFADCPALRALAIPASVEELSANALPRGVMGEGPFFLEAQGMLVRADVKRDYAVPRGTRTLAGWALSNNGALLRVDFGDALEHVGPYALADCICLKHVDLPRSVRSVEKGAFSGCHRLISAKLSPGMRRVAEEAFRDCHSLENVELPSGLEAIEDRAFEDCRSLKRLALPEGVREVGRRAFYRCTALVRLEMPESLRRIGAGALSGCTGLRVLVLNAPLGPEMYDALSDAGRAAIIAPKQPPCDFPGPCRKRVCLGYGLAVQEGIVYAPEIAAACVAWMRAHDTSFLEEALRDKALMHLLADEGCLSRESVQALLDRAEGPDQDEYRLTLLEYGNRHFGGAPAQSLSLW